VVMAAAAGAAAAAVEKSLLLHQQQLHHPPVPRHPADKEAQENESYTEYASRCTANDPQKGPKQRRQGDDL
jgi:hypothetical protein